MARKELSPFAPGRWIREMNRRYPSLWADLRKGFADPGRILRPKSGGMELLNGTCISSNNSIRNPHSNLSYRGRSSSNLATMLLNLEMKFLVLHDISPHAISFEELIIDIVQYLFPTLWYVFVGEQIGRVAIRKIRNR